jgi:hypothetical protein
MSAFSFGSPSGPKTIPYKLKIKKRAAAQSSLDSLPRVCISLAKEP